MCRLQHVFATSRSVWNRANRYSIKFSLSNRVTYFPRVLDIFEIPRHSEVSQNRHFPSHASFSHPSIIFATCSFSQKFRMHFRPCGRSAIRETSNRFSNVRSIFRPRRIHFRTIRRWTVEFSRCDVPLKDWKKKRECNKIDPREKCFSRIDSLLFLKAKFSHKGSNLLRSTEQIYWCHKKIWWCGQIHSYW